MTTEAATSMFRSSSDIREQHKKDIDRMYSDADFMPWLEKWNPEHVNEYSGNLLGLYDAFNAGKGRTDNHRDCPVEVVENAPVLL